MQKKINKKSSFLHNSYFRLQRGFTLIEVMVAVTIFSLMVGTIMEIFMWGIKEQRRALSTQKLLDETSYALEYMSRSIRMAKKELNAPACLSANGLNYETNADKNLIKFIDHNNVCTEFFLDSKQLKKTAGGATLAMTSSAFTVNVLKFNLIGESQSDAVQPRVTIFLDIQGGGQKPEERPQIKIQTTISQRNLDIRN